MSPNPSAPDLRDRLRAALPGALRSRDSVLVSALRSTLAALDNAEAVQVDGSAHRTGAVELSPRGAGAAEVERETLDDTEVAAIVRTEIADRLDAATDYAAAGHPDRAERLRAEAAALASHLGR